MKDTRENNGTWKRSEIEAELAAAYRDGSLNDVPWGSLRSTWAEVVRKLLERTTIDRSGPCLLVSGPDGTRHVDLAAEALVMGRDEGCSVCLPYGLVSRRHCRLHVEDGQWIVEDLGSSNGTLINGVPCTRKCLIGGDILQVGEATILFLSPGTDMWPDRPE